MEDGLGSFVILYSSIFFGTLARSLRHGVGSWEEIFWPEYKNINYIINSTNWKQSLVYFNRFLFLL